MDTSKEYIEMCQMATEIQKLWRNKRYKKRRLDIYHSKDWEGSWGSDGVTHISPFQHYNWNAVERDATWLPRQDQLQDMIRNKDSPTMDLRTMELWWEFFATHFIYFKSLEQIWLGYVMYEKYNKKWKNGDWVNDS